jgi:hypothetical protein
MQKPLSMIRSLRDRLKLFYFFSLLNFIICISVASPSLAQLTCHQLFDPSKVESQAKVFNLRTYVENYSEFLPVVKEMVQLGIERNHQKKPRGYCFRGVKGLLFDSGLIRKKVDGTFAYSAHAKDFLVQRGFINLLERSPYRDEIRGAYDDKIPVGAVLVYSGTNGRNQAERELGMGMGHIEIKCGPNCYVFDTVNEYPGGASGGLIRDPGIFEVGEGLFRRRLEGVYILDYFSLF